MAIQFKPHSLKQDDLIFSKDDLTIGATGTQWGKSRAGALWMKRQIHENSDPESCFLLMAPTYKIMNQSMIPYFKKVMEGIARYVGKEAAFFLNDGRTVWCRTEKDPDSIVGIPNVAAYWLDEAGKCSLYFHENIRARAASQGAKGLYTTSPYAQNWIFQNYIRPHLKGVKIPGVKIIQAASWENPFHTLHDPKKRAFERTQMDERRFQMLYGGEWGKMAGLVYDLFHEENHTIEPFALPNGTKFYGGIDWGFTDPFVIIVRAVTPDGKHYDISEFYKRGCTPSIMMREARAKKDLFGITRFYADPSRPEYIEEFNRNGLTCVPAENALRLGIDKHYEMIKSGDYKVFRGKCPHLLDEYATYHYPQPEETIDPDEDQEEIDPVDAGNHTMDASRYLTLGLRHGLDKKVPKNPTEKAILTSQKRLEYLKRKRRYTQHTEIFS